MIGDSQLIYQTMVRHWINGKKLPPENDGSDSHLSKNKPTALITSLTNNLLTTIQAIIEEVAEFWGILYTLSGMITLLYRNGFSYRKPSSLPNKYCTEAQQAFVKIYNELKDKVGDDEPILFH